jgi:hypothetical protein
MHPPPDGGPPPQRHDFEEMWRSWSRSRTEQTLRRHSTYAEATTVSQQQRDAL